MIQKNIHNSGSTQRGYMVVLVLVFSGVFALMIAGLSGFIFVQNKVTHMKEESGKAIQIAEAGLDYYKWFLAHNPNDLTDGTGTAGPYEHEYFDPEAGAIGKFSLEVSGNYECSSIVSVDVVSTGWTYAEPSVTRTVFAKYARPSIAEYSYITDQNIWFGEDEIVLGRLHSNGGIHMDGFNDSLVTSAQSTWNCSPDWGCANPYEEKDGVFGDGLGSALWDYPTELIDFVGITVDLLNTKSLAQSAGLYLPPSTDIDSSADGYHVILKDDGTVDVYVVRQVTAHRGWNIDEGYRKNYFHIAQEYYYDNYTLPSDCQVFFLEDRIWIEGVVKGKSTIVVADLLDPNIDANAILEDNITYTTLDGSDGLLLLVEGDIDIPHHSPDDFILNGLFLSQNGRFGRDYYPGSVKNSFTLLGSVINKKTGVTTWVSGNSVVSGYTTTNSSFDRKLMSIPPPLTPPSDDEYRFVEWRED